MPVSRYWRAVGITPVAGSSVTLSAFHLYEAETDPAFANTSLLLQGAGADRSRIFRDKSVAPKLLTGFGAAENSTDVTKFSNPAIQLDGSTAYIAGDRSAAYAFGTADFTVELFVYPQAYAAAGSILVAMRDAEAGIFDNMVRIDATGYVGYSDGITWRASSIQTPLNQWSHVALSRAGGTLRIFINGAEGYSGPLTLNVAGPRVLRVGVFEAYGGNPVGGFFTGFLDQIRITKGTAMYAAPFTPPSAPFSDVLSWTRVDDEATLSATIGPTAGTVADLQDADLATTATFRVADSGFALVWDFGPTGSANVRAARIGSAASEATFLTQYDLEYSDDGVRWTALKTEGPIPWPGAYTLTMQEALGALVFRTTALTLRVFAQSPVEDALVVVNLGVLMPWRDMLFSGNGFIAGTVKRDADPTDVPLKRRVRLHREADGMLLRETWSDTTTGAYRFDSIDEKIPYTVITYDYEHNYRAVIADNIVPELMT